MLYVESCHKQRDFSNHLEPIRNNTPASLKAVRFLLQDWSCGTCKYISVPRRSSPSIADCGLHVHSTLHLFSQLHSSCSMIPPKASIAYPLVNVNLVIFPPVFFNHHIWSSKSPIQSFSVPLVAFILVLSPCRHSIFIFTCSLTVSCHWKFQGLGLFCSLSSSTQNSNGP